MNAITGRDVGEFVGGFLWAGVFLGWYIYVPTYVRKRIAAGKEPAKKEAALIKGNRVVAIVGILPCIADMADVLLKIFL